MAGNLPNPEKFDRGQRVRGELREFNGRVEVLIDLRFGCGRVFLENWMVEQGLDEDNCLRKFARNQSSGEMIDLETKDEYWIEITHLPSDRRDHYEAKIVRTGQIVKPRAAGRTDAHTPLESKGGELRNISKL